MPVTPGALVLVTGATGFVGSAVVRSLLAKGYVVRALARAGSVRANLTGLDIEIVEGNMGDASAAAQAMQGASALVHAAADYRLWTRAPDALVRTNVEGTRTIMRAALDAGVERIVYTSSVATLALRSDGAPADESVRLTQAAAIGAYKRSKVAAEELVDELIARERLPAVIVQPSTPIGPRDIKPTPTGRVIVEAAAGRMPAFVDTGLNLVHVDDVAAGHVLALERGIVGEHYILGGQDVPLAELLAAIAGATGRRPPRLRLPRRALYPFAWVAEAIAARTGREPLLTVDGLRMAAHHMYFTSAKAERVLGYRARPYAQAVHDAIEWFAAAGYLSGYR